MSNDSDQEIVKSAIADTGSGLLEFLTALGQREAIAFGDGVTLPVRIKFDELPSDSMPRSSTARFTEKWQSPVGDGGFLEGIVERWRNSTYASAADAARQMAMLAEAMQLAPSAAPDPAGPPGTEGGGAPQREPMPERRHAPSVRREPAAVSPSQSATMRAIRDRMQQR
jgi:hypothetical protein